MKFIFLADTHLGASPMSYQQQKGYPEHCAKLLKLLGEWIASEGGGGVDFILHGGDMVDAASESSLALAESLFPRDIPVHLCLGNHDLTTAKAAELWLRRAPRFFPGGTVEFSVRKDNVMLHCVPNHWGPDPGFWQPWVAQDAALDAQQIQRLETELERNPNCAHVLCLHSPVFGLPVEQTGFERPLHPPSEAFTQMVADLARRRGNLKLVLGAHNHMNVKREIGGVKYITVSSFVESPFEFKLFEVTAKSAKMSTHNLSRKVDFKFLYNYDKTFVQGRLCDRTVERAF